MACLFLATKLEETARKHREIISVFHRIERRREGRSLDHLDLYGNVRPLADHSFWTMKEMPQPQLCSCDCGNDCTLMRAGILREEGSSGQG